MSNRAPSPLLPRLKQIVGGPEQAELPDARLLESFIDLGDTAAFDCLVRRHGPMIYRACLRILRQPHDAEDASQATFLVLCGKAKSIRRQECLGSWLYQVAARIALKLRTDSVRKGRSIVELDALAAPESQSNLEVDESRWVVDDELSQLPEKYRVPLVLHYLEGKPVAEVAQDLGLLYGTALMRLARGRDKLRRRLSRRGLAPSAGMLWLTEAVQTAGQLVMPSSLAQSTTKLAEIFVLGQFAGSGVTAPKAAALALGMRQAMLYGQLTAGLGLFVALAGVLAVTIVAIASLPAAQTKDGNETKTELIETQPVAEKMKYRLKGVVRLEGTIEPLAGATIRVHQGASHLDAARAVQSDKDGTFALDVDAGNAFVNFYPPIGYLRSGSGSEQIALTKTAPEASLNFRARRGTRWDFKVTNGPTGETVPGTVTAFSRSRPTGGYRSQKADDGIQVLTLPSEFGEMSILVQKETRGGSFSSLHLEWDDHFQPEAIKSIERVPGDAIRYRLTDLAGNSATLATTDLAEAKMVRGKLVIDVPLPAPDPKNLVELIGRVVDEHGKPIANALITLAYLLDTAGPHLSENLRPQTKTDSQGNYRFSAIECLFSAKKPGTVRLSASREGFASIESAPFQLEPPVERPQNAGLIRLASGMSITGVVKDPQGNPVFGALVAATKSETLVGQPTKSDEAGHFTVRDLPAGLVSLHFSFGPLFHSDQYRAEAKPQPITVQLTIPQARAPSSRIVKMTERTAGPTSPAGRKAPEKKQ
jgi:RNA polymerase sigma factor (sigma-70 family)